MGASAKREIKDLIRIALDQGWRVEQLRSGHWRFLPADTNVRAVVTGGTPSDPRAVKNLRSDLRRSGLKLDGLGNAGGLVGGLFGG